MRILISLMMVAVILPAYGAAPLGCTGSSSLGTFRLLIRPFSPGAPLPLKSVGNVAAGSRLIWDPVHLMLTDSSKAEVTVVVLPASDGHLITLEPRKAAAKAEWQLFERPEVVALLFGPQGLSEAKIQSLVSHNAELLKELADYADQSTRVETLIQQLADAEQQGISTDSALKGFSTQYGVAAPKLDTKASSDQQASLLLKALLPASNAYDPLASRSAQAQQSTGLAASVAGMFFGSSVGLAAGGATLFQNLKTAMFPATEFRSAFAQSAEKDDFALCTKNLAPKSKTRTAYLWAYRLPEYKKPALSIAGTTDLPLGSKSKISVKFAHGATEKELDFLRDWKLMPVSGGSPTPVEVRPATGNLEVDLSKVHASPGDYQLAATWDWTPFTVNGTLHLHSYSDFKSVKLAPGEGDRLLEGRGNVNVKLVGADFEFLEKAALAPAVPHAKAIDETFNLPLGERHGAQTSVALDLNAQKQGSYRLLLTQSDGVEHSVPITVLPPNPKVSNCPVRVHLGEKQEAIQLQGSGLERIEHVSSEAGEITGRSDEHGWSGEIVLKPGVVKGRKFALILKVKGLEEPLTLADAIEVVGARPRILSVRRSLASDLGIEIGPDELPAGTAVGLALTVGQYHQDGRPRLEVTCTSGDLRQPLVLSPGESRDGATLTLAGPGAFYLSLDPGAVGYAGCDLAATMTLEPEGRSDHLALGRVIRIPHLETFNLTTEKIGDSSYAGVLQGRDLDVIEKTGWDGAHGVGVESIPAPLPGDRVRQTLRVAMPWPAPSPHAPLYVWLRGETIGRKTTVVY